LDEDDIEIGVDLENSIHNKIVFSNILRKDFDIVDNHIMVLFMAEQVEVLWFSQSLAYSLVCHSLLNLYF